MCCYRDSGFLIPVLIRLWNQMEGELLYQLCHSSNPENLGIFFTISWNRWKNHLSSYSQDTNTLQRSEIAKTIQNSLSRNIRKITQAKHTKCKWFIYDLNWLSLGIVTSDLYTAKYLNHNIKLFNIYNAEQIINDTTNIDNNMAKYWANILRKFNGFGDCIFVYSVHCVYPIISH